MKHPIKQMSKQTADFLFEIGCEEIPAGMLPGAIKELKVILDKYLGANNLLIANSLADKPSTLTPTLTLGAPRRLAALCPDIRMRQPDETREVVGPPKGVAYDA